jgi:phenylacetate-CoA ligase
MTPRAEPSTTTAGLRSADTTRSAPFVTVELSIIAPCFNEVDNIGELVERTLRVFDEKDLDAELVLVDDGSRDGTAEAIRENAALHGERVRGVFHDVNSGIESAWRSGLESSTGAYVCLIDADLQNQPEDIFRLFREIQFSRVDLVQGTRSHIGRLKDSRFLLSRTLNGLLNLCFGMRATDNKSGFVLCRREVLREILRHRLRYRYFQTFIRVAAHAHGYRVREVETLFESRIHGDSFIKGRFPAALIFHVFVDLAKALREYRFSRYRDLLMEEFVLSALPESAPSPAMKGLRSFWFRLYNLSMPLHHWMISRRAGYYYRILERSQWLPRATLEKLQEAKLRRLIEHAYWHVPHYREVMDAAGLKPSDIQSAQDLPKLAMLSKQQVRDRRFFDLMSDNHRKKDVYRISTSGSTGQPLTCWVDRHQLELRWASTLRSQQWTGYRFGDRTVRLWHQTIGMDRIQVFKERLDSILSRRRLVPAFEFDEAGVSGMVRVLRRHRPVLVDGYAESFNYLARSGFGSELHRLGIRGLMSSAQTLDEESRRAIEETFGAPVFDKYGSREFSGIAYECDQHSGHHVVAERFVVELVVDGRPAAPGELGEVVITDLDNLVMPLIRYRIGDLAYAVNEGEPCGCGRELPRIGAIEGRTQAIIIGGNGCAMPSSFFLHVLKDYGYAFARFQIEQSSAGEFVFRYVPARRFSNRVLEEVLAIFRSFLGRETEILVETVDRIEMVRTGKYQAVINHMALDYQAIETVLDPRGEDVRPAAESGEASP